MTGIVGRWRFDADEEAERILPVSADPSSDDPLATIEKRLRRSVDGIIRGKRYYVVFFEDGTAIWEFGHVEPRLSMRTHSPGRWRQASSNEFRLEVGQGESRATVEGDRLFVHMSEGKDPLVYVRVRDDGR